MWWEHHGGSWLRPALWPDVQRLAWATSKQPHVSHKAGEAQGRGRLTLVLQLHGVCGLRDGPGISQRPLGDVNTELRQTCLICQCGLTRRDVRDVSSDWFPAW